MGNVVHPQRVAWCPALAMEGGLSAPADVAGIGSREKVKWDRSHPCPSSLTSTDPGDAWLAWGHPPLGQVTSQA